jgi:GNAT superfamily N-acetyltransferase
MDPTHLLRALRGLVEEPSRGLVLAAYDDEESKNKNRRAIGIAVLSHTWTIEHGGRCTWLDELYVVPERRNAGLGRALIHAAIEAAKREGCAAMDLEVENDHARVESLYLREGFTRRTRNRFVRRL